MYLITVTTLLSTIPIIMYLEHLYKKLNEQNQPTTTKIRKLTRKRIKYLIRSEAEWGCVICKRPVGSGVVLSPNNAFGLVCKRCVGS